MKDKDVCKGCQYYSSMASVSAFTKKICNYATIEGKSRLLQEYEYIGCEDIAMIPKDHCICKVEGKPINSAQFIKSKYRKGKQRAKLITG